MKKTVKLGVYFEFDGNGEVKKIRYVGKMDDNTWKHGDATTSADTNEKNQHKAFAKKLIASKLEV